MININDFLLECLNNHMPKNKLTQFEDDYFNDEIYGIVKKDILLDFLKLSKNSNLKKVLPFILSFSDKDSISTEVFEFIIKQFGRKERKSMLISLAHCNISFYQLTFIAKEKICFEAFAALLNMYLGNDCFSLYDLQNLIEENYCYLNTLDIDGISRDTKYDNQKVLLLQTAYHQTC